MESFIAGEVRQNDPIFRPNGKFWEILGNGRGHTTRGAGSRIVRDRRFYSVVKERATILPPALRAWRRIRARRRAPLAQNARKTLQKIFNPAGLL
jgi:hypothetical protein